MDDKLAPSWPVGLVLLRETELAGAFTLPGDSTCAEYAHDGNLGYSVVANSDQPGTVGYLSNSRNVPFHQDIQNVHADVRGKTSSRGNYPEYEKRLSRIH